MNEKGLRKCLESKYITLSTMLVLFGLSLGEGWNLKLKVVLCFEIMYWILISLS